MKKVLSFLLIIVIVLSCTGCGSKHKKKEAKLDPNTSTFKYFNTVCSVTIYDKLSKDELKRIQFRMISLCNYYDRLFNKKDKESDVFKLNRDKNANVSYETEDVIDQAQKISIATSGDFDITISPIVDLWDINGLEYKNFTDEEINKQLKYVDFKQLTTNKKIDPNNNNIMLFNVGITNKGSIDLGGIAKGYVTDILVKELKKDHVKSAVINLGGNIYVHGKKGKSLFKVGIQTPFSGNTKSAIVKTSDKAVITSGTYQRYKKMSGKIYSHIMNPHTGRPIDNDLRSATIICNEATVADGMSTAIMVMGLNKGMEFVNKTVDIEAILIDDDNKVHLSDGLKKNGDIVTLKK